MSAQVLFQRRNLWRGSPARALEPPVTYRLGVDTGGQWGHVGKLVGQEKFEDGLVARGNKGDG
jgi:hypothetical protein